MEQSAERYTISGKLSTIKSHCLKTVFFSISFSCWQTTEIYRWSAFNIVKRPCIDFVIITLYKLLCVLLRAYLFELTHSCLRCYGMLAQCCVCCQWCVVMAMECLQSVLTATMSLQSTMPLSPLVTCPSVSVGRFLLKQWHTGNSCTDTPAGEWGNTHTLAFPFWI